MFQFLRRVSTSFLTRPDRSWQDATSNTPSIGRKRRFSVTDREEEEDIDIGSVSKRARNAPMPLEDAPLSPEDSGNGQKNVKSVAQGVKEVELGDKGDEPPVQPESVPLPESPAGSPPPETRASSTRLSQEPQDKPEDDTNSASSSEEDTEADTNTLSSPEEETLEVDPVASPTDGESQSGDAMTSVEEDALLTSPVSEDGSEGA